MKDLLIPTQAGAFEAWVNQCFEEIERQAQLGADAIAADFTVTGTLTERRTLDAGTATLAELRDFVCTLLVDIQKQGQKRRP